MVEKLDFASGTSSRSTKLIHGGVRYLQKAIMKLDLEQVMWGGGVRYLQKAIMKLDLEQVMLLSWLSSTRSRVPPYPEKPGQI